MNGAVGGRRLLGRFGDRTIAFASDLPLFEVVVPVLEGHLRLLAAVYDPRRTRRACEAAPGRKAPADLACVRRRVGARERAGGPPDARSRPSGPDR